MKKIYKTFFFIPFLLTSLASCSNNQVENNGETIFVHVLNAEDYIDMTLLDSFSQMIYERDGKNVSIIYDTYDTNETMYNSLKTGKTTYDLICCSEYMVQRLANEGFLHTLDFSKLPNYTNYTTEYLHSFDDENGKLNLLPVVNEYGTYTLADYAAGYMRGTLGILFNPDYVLTNNQDKFDNNPEWKNLSYEERKEKLIETFSSEDGYSFLWNDLITRTQSIKDSMRDTYAIGNFEVFKDYYLNTSDSYNERNTKFNDSSDETIELIKNKLIELKTNIFGFEVDSGKNDIVTQKIGVNVAWSGDAVNSINRGYYADDEWTKPREDEVELHYAIPEIGANVWMDCFATPLQEDENYYSSDEYKYTLEFLDFLSSPENAIANVYYNGYTSFITSDSSSDEIDNAMLAYMLYSYDISDGDDDEDLSSYETYDITPFFNIEENVESFTVDLSYVSETLLGEEVDDRVFTFSKNEDGEIKILIHYDPDSFEGRLLSAQYPEASVTNTLYVMNDYGPQNDKIVSMWEDVKVNPLPLWIVISLLTFVALVLGYLGSYKLIRIYKLKRRKKLRELNK